MRGGHDLGGMHGLGPVLPKRAANTASQAETEEKLFHAEWEKRAFGFTLALGALGLWNLDISRHARERQHPADYLTKSYYEIWMAGVETLLQEFNLVTPEELASGTSTTPAPEALQKKRLTPNAVAPTLARGGPVVLPTQEKPSLNRGDPVRVVVQNPLGHTRAPTYTIGKRGHIDQYQGYHIFPDRHALGQKQGGHLYSVRFESRALWGSDAHTNTAVYVDLWQEYLETAN